MLVGFGQTVCLPVGRKCGLCPLAGRGLCKSEIRGWVKKEEKKKRVKKEEEEDEGRGGVAIEVELGRGNAAGGMEQQVKREQVEVEMSQVIPVKEELEEEE